MAEITTDALQQALLLLIQDSKESRKRDKIRFERLDQTMAESQRKSDEQWEKTRQELEKLTKETDRQIKQTNKQMGELSAKMGTLVEDLVSPDMLRLLREVAHLSEEVDGLVNVRLKRAYPGPRTNGKSQMIELDAVAECGEYVLINETKNTFRPEYVTDFIKRLTQIRDYFPEYRDRQILGSVSSLRIDSSVVTQASHQGLLVFTVGEGLLQILNEAGFQPKRF